MSHICGTVPVLGTPQHVGPDSGAAQTAPNTWQHDFNYVAAGTKFIILHFMNVSLPASNRLEVDLGYDMDVFTSADGGSFWTRPINIHNLPGGTVPIRYITDGANTGGVFVDRYGRAHSLQSTASGHNSITNCDPFLPGPWIEPVFPHGPGETDPKYDPFWICNKTNPPVWENVRCAAPGTVQRDVAQSAGMIVTIHQPSADHPMESVSSCSVTLIDSDLVALAGHCISDHGFEVPTSSVTFDFEVNCDGSVQPAYNAVFYKVLKLVKYRWADGRDYAILQLRGAPPVPPVPVRNSLPAIGEAVFGVHHPNGAVKKTGPSAVGTVPVDSAGNFIGVNLDVAGGSSGSGLFDISGRLVGVLGHGSACNLFYSSSVNMLNDPIEVPNPPDERAVMLVMDRSGSMGGTATGGGVKIDEAREAAELFVSMMRASMGNQAGLVSFASNASNPLEFTLKPLTNGTRGQLLAELPGIMPNGRTSIGDGLAAARDELAGAAGMPRSILLLTDGMENEPQAIADVTGLSGIEITAIGFGTESNLDGPRLTDLAQTHGGFYKRAGTGLELRKFFALAFGDIFEAGALADPDMYLSATMRQGPKIPFSVCDEEAVTVVAAWDDGEADLLVEVTTPGGQVLNLSAGGIETDSGQTWRFARIPLPQQGERDGTWTARVLRPGQHSVEFPPPSVPVNYFVNVIARGGPSLRPYQQPRKLYTGDTLNPRVILQYADETVPRGGMVTLNLRRPNASVGTTLATNGLGPAGMVDGDLIPARQATLMQIEAANNAPVATYVEETHALSDGAADAGTFRPAGVFGKLLDEVLVVDGTYTFHAKARIDGACSTTREVQWSHHVSVGIDPDATSVTVTPSATTDGRVVVTFTPQDKYGNHVGPGAADDMTVTPLPGCTPVGGLIDLGDGRYRQDLECDPDSETPTGVTVTQPERDPVVLVPPVKERMIYRYPVQLICGDQSDECCDCGSVRPGRYATSITIFNGSPKSVAVAHQVLATAFSGAVLGRWPDAADVRAHDRMKLEPMSSTTIDCCSVNALLLGAPTTAPQALTQGTVLIESLARLHVTAAYTMTGSAGAGASIDIEVVEPVSVTSRVEAPDRPDPHTIGTRPTVRSNPPPRPQDIPRKPYGSEPKVKKSKKTDRKKSGSRKK
ncbi:MAG: VWA domain-containing protein [Rhizobiales bacterium]|nr:VWA domain-containing protein [Hyphomicrobiales bacterium]